MLRGMKWIVANWFKIAFILAVGFAFYWYSLRPYLAERYCSNHAYQANKNADNTFRESGYDGTFKVCMEMRGL